MWDALHLYIANNLDWMEHWIEDCEECFGRLSWEGVSEMIKTTHHHRHQFPDLVFSLASNSMVFSAYSLFIAVSAGISSYASCTDKYLHNNTSKYM